MKASYSGYSHTDGDARIKEILNSSDFSNDESKDIPSRDSLTFTNGYYVNCAAMFVDMRKSSELPSKYKRPRLARIYRTFVSELVAVFRDHTKVSEINIQGDCVWGIFDCPYQDDINELFSVAAKVSSVLDIINWRFEKKEIEPIQIGIGLDYGRSLMIKAGYKGSAINNIVWMGDVVNTASKLCSQANQIWQTDELLVSSAFYGNLNDYNKGLLRWSDTATCYHGCVVNTDMNDWLKEQTET